MHQETEGPLSDSLKPTFTLLMFHASVAVCLANLTLYFAYLPPSGHSRLEGAGVGHREARLVRWNFPLPILALRRLGGRGDWRPAPDGGQSAGVLPLQRQQRVLERTGGKGLRQVSISGKSKYLFCTNRNWTRMSCLLELFCYLTHRFFFYPQQGFSDITVDLGYDTYCMHMYIGCMFLLLICSLNMSAAHSDSHPCWSLFVFYQESSS